MAERKNPELDAKHQAILRQMMQLPENKQCADCKGPAPRWASTNLGIFVCISCSGIHRKLGTHISQVRSVTLDTWTPTQVARFQKFGNAKAAQYFEACLPPDFRRPASGDSMQMERFIRDKYERKRFITIENGGLGGRSTGRDAGLSNKSELQGNAPKTGARYDDAGSVKKGTGIALSYGDRFRAETQASNTSRSARSGASGLYNSGRGFGIGARPGNAIQRAHTLREIMNMGFSAEIAARAVEASAGDLQRAVDWVLEHSDTSGVPPRTSNQQVTSTIEDLIGFDDAPPNPKSDVAPASKIMGDEALVSGQAASASATKASNTEFEDFADFGAFESALPAVRGSSHDLAAQPSKSSFSSSIASLYSRNPSKMPTTSSPGVTQFQSMGAAQKELQKPSVSTNSTLFSSPQGLHTIPGATSQTTASRSSQPTEKKSPGRMQNVNPVGAKQLGHPPANGIGKGAFATGRPGVPPPPPPPLQEITASNATGVPPPPDSPPPGMNGTVLSHEVYSHAQPQQTSDSSPHLNRASDGKASVPPAETFHAEKKPTGESQEDPFAELSMFALKSVKAKPKTELQKNNPRKDAMVQDSAALSKPTPATSASTEVNLDDLLG